MKKVISLFLSFVLLLSFCSCDIFDIVGNLTDFKNDISKDNEIVEFEKPQEKYRVIKKFDDLDVDKIEYFSCRLNYNFCVAQKDGKYGLIDYKGEIILPIEYYDIFPVETPKSVFELDLTAVPFSGSSFLVNNDGSLSEMYSWGRGGPYIAQLCLWCNGDFVMLDPTEGEITDLEKAYELYENYGSTTGIVPQQPFSRIIPVKEATSYSCDSDEMGHFNYDPKAEYVSDKYALFSFDTGNLVTDFVFDSYGALEFINGIMPVEKNGKWGYINESGEMITDFSYIPIPYSHNYSDYETPYFPLNGFVILRTENGYGMMNTDGEIILDTKYEWVSQADKLGRVWVKENGKWSLIKINKN